MPKFTVRFSTVAELSVEVEVPEGADEYDTDLAAEEAAAKLVEDFLNTHFIGPVRLDASIDGVGANETTRLPN